MKIRLDSFHLEPAAFYSKGNLATGRNKRRKSRDNRERASHALCSGSPCGTTAHGKSKT